MREGVENRAVAEVKDACCSSSIPVYQLMKYNLHINKLLRLIFKFKFPSNVSGSLKFPISIAFSCKVRKVY